MWWVMCHPWSASPSCISLAVSPGFVAGAFRRLWKSLLIAFCENILSHDSSRSIVAKNFYLAGKWSFVMTRCHLISEKKSIHLHQWPGKRGLQKAHRGSRWSQRGIYKSVLRSCCCAPMQRPLRILQPKRIDSVSVLISDAQFENVFSHESRGDLRSVTSDRLLIQYFVATLDVERQKRSTLS